MMYGLTYFSSLASTAHATDYYGEYFIQYSLADNIFVLEE